MMHLDDKSMEPSPISDFLDEKGERRKAAYSCNAKGGMKDDMGVQYIRDLVLPCFPHLTPEKPLVIICYGHGSHLTLALVDFCRANNITIVLRVPHTWPLTQGEDRQNFKILKALVRRNRHECLKH
eukprot:1731513-Pleurochrysis_carterae.AAC.1